MHTSKQNSRELLDEEYKIAQKTFPSPHLCARTTEVMPAPRNEQQLRRGEKNYEERAKKYTRDNQQQHQSAMMCAKHIQQLLSSDLTFLLANQLAALSGALAGHTPTHVNST